MFPKRFNWGGKIYLECGIPVPYTGPQIGLKEKEESVLGSYISSFSFLMCTQCDKLPHIPTAISFYHSGLYIASKHVPKPEFSI